MFEVSADQTFAAGHALRGYQGKCENVHGHNYRVRVTLQGEELNSIGLLVDFVDIKRAMKEIIEYWDHKFINDLPPFDKLNPTAENMAWWFCQQMQEKLQGGLAQVPVTIKEVTLWETEKNIAVYRP
jgi:6-pyruvoyltetrahydropterin/6-carboxytetrahydropterin synthase